MRVLFPLAFLAFLSAFPAVAEIRGTQVTGDPDQIAKLMAERGMPAKRGADIEGLPMLESQVDDTQFNVYFYECQPVCEHMQFVTGFDLPAPMTPQTANEWNRANPFAKLVVSDSGDAFLEMDIGLAGDGIGRKNFDKTLESWRVTMNEFRNYMNW